MTLGKSLWMIILIKLFIILAVFRLFFFPDFLKEKFDNQEERSEYVIEELTIENSSSSHYTLRVMSYVSLFVPFVLAYIFCTWRVLTKRKVDQAELEKDGHIY
jgi:cytochrome bd-type quinol oxidase subunit 2